MSSAPFEGRTASVPLAPVRTSLEVATDPSRAFELFTTELGRWWPLGTHSIAADEGLTVRAVDARIEPRVGGRIMEVWDDGSEVSWGTVLALEPPRRLLLDWNPSRTRAVGTEVEITFEASPRGTLVRLEHRRWERLGDIAERVRSGYETGWPRVLARLVDRIQGEVVGGPQAAV